MTGYEENVTRRSWARYVIGFCVRWRNRWRMDKLIRSLRKSGAVVGKNNSLTKRCRFVGGSNLVIGDCCSFQDAEIDSRAPVKIGNHVIIGDRSRIITCSHDIDNSEWTLKKYGIDIEDYVWIASNAIILPSCRRIGRGAVIGGGGCCCEGRPPDGCHGRKSCKGSSLSKMRSQRSCGREFAWRGF